MNANLTPLKKMRTFDEYWKNRPDPSAVTAWEEALHECEKAFRQERHELITALEIATAELLKKDPLNEIGKIIRETMEFDSHNHPGNDSPGAHGESR